MTTFHLHACADAVDDELGWDVDWAFAEHRASTPQEWGKGRRLLVVAASTPPALMYEVEVTATVEARYSNKIDAWQRLRSVGGSAASAPQTSAPQTLSRETSAPQTLSRE